MLCFFLPLARVVPRAVILSYGIVTWKPEMLWTRPQPPPPPTLTCELDRPPLDEASELYNT